MCFVKKLFDTVLLQRASTTINAMFSMRRVRFALC